MLLCCCVRLSWLLGRGKHCSIAIFVDAIFMNVINRMSKLSFSCPVHTTFSELGLILLSISRSRESDRGKGKCGLLMLSKFLSSLYSLCPGVCWQRKVLRGSGKLVMSPTTICQLYYQGRKARLVSVTFTVFLK